MVVATVILGTVAYKQIPVRLFPDTAPPLVNVVTAWPGATATDVDRDLTDILATEFASIEGVIRISETSQDNLSRVQIEFSYGTDVRMGAVDIQNAISQIGEDLPEDAHQPRVMTFSSAARPVYTVGVVAEDLLAARRLAQDVVAPRLQAVGGVATVDVFGGQISTVLVDVDPRRAEAHRVSLAHVAGAISANNRSVPAGRLRSSTTETMLRVDQRAARVEQLEDLMFPLPDGGQLRVGNVAQVHRGSEKDDSWFSINGQRAIAVQVYRSDDANTVAVVAGVNKVVDALKADFPELTFVPGEESASFTEQSVSNLLGNVWQALLLASAILFLFLGRARAALITAFTMPLAFGLTFGVMWLMAMEFNMVTLSAVILAVGMVVDASVVVLENIVRLRDQGKDPVEAAKEGTDEVLVPVFAGIATTLVVLVPLLSLPGFVGRVFGPLAITLLIAFSSSVLVALILVPILSLQMRDTGPVERIAGKISYPFTVVMDGLRDGYLRLLDSGLRRRWLVLLVAALLFAVGVAGLRGAGMNLLPRMDGGTFTIALETPSGSALEKTTAVIGQVEKILAEQPEVRLVQSQAGFETGMQSAGGSGVMGATQGFLSVTLSARTERARTIWQIEQVVRNQIRRIPGVTSVVIKEVGNTAKPTTVAPIVARVSGPDPLVLDRLADDVVKSLSSVEALVEPTRSWRRDMRRQLVHVDPRKAASIGQTPLTIARFLTMGAEGIDAGDWTPELAAAEPIKVRYARTEAPSVQDTLSWPLFVPGTGEAVPVRAVAHAYSVVEQGLYTSEDLNPVLDILAQIDGRPLSFVVADAAEAIKSVVVPQGYSVSITGENKDMLEARKSILSALAVSILAVYLLLVAQFRSWLHPLTVMMAVPLSLSGVSAALTLVGKPVSMPVMVGLVLLVGTVVNNSILLVDLIRRRRDAGDDRRAAIRESVRARFRPIMMTSLSTVIGMLPLAMELALGAERFSPLATAVIGGLLASTLLTLIVIPVLYDVADSIGSRRSRGALATVGTAGVVALLMLPNSAWAQSTSLQDAWQMSLKHPGAVAADLQVQAAQARVKAATGRLLPKAELSARASYLSYVQPGQIVIPFMLPDGSTPDPLQLGEAVQQHYVLGIAVTQPLFAGGALLQGRKAASAGLQMEAARRDGTKSGLWLNLVQAWYGLAVAQEVVLIQTQQVEATLAREQSLQRLLAGGRVTELQLSAVALKRSEAEQALAEAKLSAIMVAQALQALTGAVTVPQKTAVAEAARAMASVQMPSGVPASLRQMTAQAATAAAMAKAANGKLLPSVALRLGAQYANPNTRYFPIKDAWNGSWDASLVMSWTLDSGVRWHEASSAKLQAAAAKSAVAATKRQTTLQLKQAQASVTLGITQLNVAAERIQLARRAVEAASTGLANGRITPAEVIEREADLGLAQIAEQKAAFGVIMAVEKSRALAGVFGPS